jgi:hypothetical protein
MALDMCRMSEKSRYGGVAPVAMTPERKTSDFVAGHPVRGRRRENVSLGGGRRRRPRQDPAMEEGRY